MTSQQSMNGGPPIRTWSLVLILWGLVGFGSAGAQWVAAPPAVGMRTAAAIATGSETHATSSATIGCLGTDSEEIVDPLENRSGQAQPHSVAHSAVAPEAFIPFGSRRTVPIRTPSIDSVEARGPPST